MKIVIDAFGGDYAPLEPIKGAVRAKNELGCDIALSGTEQIIRKTAADNGIDISGIEILDAQSVMTYDDEPKAVLKKKNDSSMAVGLKAVAAGEADVFISAGSTAALLMGSTFIVKRIKGVSRPALGAVLPGLNGHVLLMDCGANAECRPEMLKQFAYMGSLYMEKVLGVKAPRVGLLNNGTEDSKGLDLQKDTNALLKEEKEINYVGNVEGRALGLSECDVVITDGFTGNIALKSIEGIGSAVGKKLKGAIKSSFTAKLGALLMKKQLKDFAKSLDYSEVGGAPFIGLKAPVIKAHGNSTEKMFFSASKQAVQWAGSGMIEALEEKFSGSDDKEEKE